MSEVNKLPKSLPGMERPFDVLVTGQLTGKQYVGNFESKIPTSGDRARMRVLQAQLNQGQEKALAESDPEVLFFHEMVAYLRYALTKSPEWWMKSDGGRELHDSNVVAEVYMKAMNFESEWQEQVWGPKEPKNVEGEGQPQAD